MYITLSGEFCALTVRRYTESPLLPFLIIARSDLPKDTLFARTHLYYRFQTSPQHDSRSEADRVLIRCRL